MQQDLHPGSHHHNHTMVDSRTDNYLVSLARLPQIRDILELHDTYVTVKKRRTWLLANRVDLKKANSRKYNLNHIIFFHPVVNALLSLLAENRPTHMRHLSHLTRILTDLYQVTEESEQKPITECLMFHNQE